jgi:hypothetical protein
MEIGHSCLAKWSKQMQQLAWESGLKLDGLVWMIVAWQSLDELNENEQRFGHFWACGHHGICLMQKA